MTDNKQSRPDHKPVEGRNRLRTDKVKTKDITLKIQLPGQIAGPTDSTKLNKQSLIRIWIADNSKLAKMPYWKVEREFNKLSKRQQENIAKRRPWNFKLDDIVPAEFLPIPYFHIPRRQSEAHRVMHLSEEQVATFIDRHTYPPRFNKKPEEWERMTERQRLTFHFNQIAEGNPYKWAYVE